MSTCIDKAQSSSILIHISSRSMSSPLRELELIAAESLVELTLHCLPEYLALPNENGTYRYLIMCCICRLTVILSVIAQCPHLLVVLNSLVKENRTNQYITNTGQKTGKLKISKKLQNRLNAIALVALCQNLNSGNRRMNGRNSSSCFVGSTLCDDSPSSRPSLSLMEGSNFGWRKARKRLRR